MFWFIHNIVNGFITSLDLSVCIPSSLGVRPHTSDLRVQLSHWPLTHRVTLDSPLYLWDVAHQPTSSVCCPHWLLLAVAPLLVAWSWWLAYSSSSISLIIMTHYIIHLCFSLSSFVLLVSCFFSFHECFALQIFIHNYHSHLLYKALFSTDTLMYSMSPCAPPQPGVRVAIAAPKGHMGSAG